MQQLLFILFSVIILGAALMVVTTKNLFHAALFLILSFFGVAGFYVLLEAGFFAVAQVLVYIGAISILIIFAVMLTRGMQSMTPRNSQAVTAAVVCGIIFVVLLLVFQPAIISIDFSRVISTSTARQLGGIPWANDPAFTSKAVASTMTDDYIRAFGNALTDPSQYAVPFELASVLILLALIGAIWVARERRPFEILAERAEISREIAEEEAADAAAAQPAPTPLPEAAHATAAAAAHGDGH